MKSAEVIACLLAHKFAGTKWAVVKEFRPAAGYGGDQRRLDLYAILCEPSKGMPKHAVEVKVSRADWLAELRQPMKRRLGMAISNYFWIAAPVGVVKPDELPAMCGLLEVPDGWQGLEPWAGLRTTHPAEYRDAVRPTWALVASLLRRPLIETTKGTSPAGTDIPQEFRAKAAELRARNRLDEDAVDPPRSTMKPHEREMMAMVYDYCAERTEARSMGIAMDPLARSTLSYARAGLVPLPGPSEQGGRLTKPAQVNHTVFQAGLPESMVVECAQRHYEWRQVGPAFYPPGATSQQQVVRDEVVRQPPQRDRDAELRAALSSAREGER